MGKGSTEEALNSSALSRVLLCVIGGQNYSAVVARELNYSQPAAVQNLKKLEVFGIIKGKREGGSIVYTPEWVKIASLWVEYVGAHYLREAGAVSSASKGKWKFNEETKKPEKISVEEADRENRQRVLKSLTALKAKPQFLSFAKAYFKALAQVDYVGSLQEAFALFAYEVEIDEQLRKLFEKKDFDFIEFLKPRSSFLGLKVATQLRVQILDMDDDARV